jgi:GNAT superfamily N-acetyltransferase
MPSQVTGPFRAGLAAASRAVSVCVADTVGVTFSDRRIRRARPSEHAALRSLELEADRLFETVGIGPFADDPSEDHSEQAALVLVVDDPPVAFVVIEIVDGQPHIWQLSVHPDHARRGLGTALIAAVCEWALANGFEAITLTTFRDVPWNGPFYASRGFVLVDDLTPELAAIRDHEGAIGDDDFGPRVAMRLTLLQIPTG